MTLDDLQKIYHAAWRDDEGCNPQRAGIAAVIRAVRDEMQFGDWTAWHRLNEILGVAESEKASGSEPASVHTQEQRPDPQVAGSAKTVDAQQCQTNTIPATAPAPAVCVWTQRGANEPGFYSTPHGIRHHIFFGRMPCPVCGGFIKFTEAK